MPNNADDTKPTLLTIDALPPLRPLSRVDCYDPVLDNNVSRSSFSRGSGKMIDHIGILVSNIARATEFYLKALAPLGIGIVREVSTEETGGSPHVAFGRGQKPFFWLRQGLSGPLHI